MLFFIDSNPIRSTPSNRVWSSVYSTSLIHRRSEVVTLHPFLRPKRKNVNLVQ